jgi:predicted neuraminidase
MSPGGRERYLPMAVFAVAVALALPALQPSASPRLLPPAAQPVTAAAPAEMERRFLPNPAPSAHSVTLADLGQGRIAAAWFAGSREGAADVTIVFATFDGKAWSPARSIVKREQAQRDSGRLVRKLGNPVLWHDANGRLHLWFVSVGYGGWAGSAINHAQSDDGGQTWSPARRLITSPFFNLSTLVHAAPLPLADGGVALPVYHEFIAKRPEWLHLDAHQQVIDKQRLPASGGELQPAAAALNDHDILALLRDAGPHHRIHASRSEDGGTHWSAATATALANPNAGIALLHLADGRLLLASNPEEAKRNLLALQVSSDQGQTWSTPRFVERGASEDEYSYPALLQDDTGMIHLAYTWQREKICHLRFAPAALGGSK